MCPSAGGYQLAVPPAPPLEELLVLSLLGVEEVEAEVEVEKAAVSAAPKGSNGADGFRLLRLGIVRSSRSTKEEEKVQTRDCRSPRDQKVPAEHRPPPSKAPVFTTRTHPSQPSLTHNDRDSKITCFGFTTTLQVREVAQDMTTQANDYTEVGLRWQSSAILALQEAAEAYLVHLFEDA